MKTLDIVIATKATDYISLFNRRDPRDHDALDKKLREAQTIGLSSLRVADTPHPHHEILTSASIYFDHSRALTFDLALLLTQVTIRECFDLIVVDGYPPQFHRYLPRLRWILHHYQTRFILFGDR